MTRETQLKTLETNCRPPFRSKPGNSSEVLLTLDLAFPAAVAQLYVGGITCMAHLNVTLFPLDAPGHWNFKRLAAVFVIALVLQALFLPCLCDIGRAKMGLGLALDLLLGIRAGVA